jgi:hypothetical protein
MRIRRSFERPEGKKSARLIIIACEGKETEKIYFNAVKNSRCAGNVHMEVLERDSTDSSPSVVYNQLKQFQDTYQLEDDDELWIVIDKDRWNTKTLAGIARLCTQSKFMHFAMSNPCFELWLLLHCEDVASMSAEELKALQENKRVSHRGDTWLKSRVRHAMGSYRESSYDAGKLMGLIGIARDRAAALDKNKSERWPSSIGTHVYKLIDSIMDKK